MKAILVAASLAAALGGCADSTATAVQGPIIEGEREGIAPFALRDASGREVARAQVGERGNGVRVDLTASGLAPGTYAMHVHAVGRCDGPDFTTAGAHWNPDARQHGRDNPAGAHRGDLPNLVVGANRRGTVGFDMAGASLTAGATPVVDADGAALLIHASADDYRTDPSGNSGARIACGLIR